ncbi:hypothetical protein [Flexivirga oryzae]|uniref:Uncharacterized protein n=1 Tax=Flexivirga oryzae TaxID=1794944 RepID=A0A839ND01_9MICO|nr:hypothetical protein [Flexivirga oryzae]MBB2894739.1 hypothetical protein [Flexivirga oryzae]
MIRRGLLVLCATCAAVLLPWTAYLGTTLPTDHRADAWRAAWVGFDLALFLLFGCALWLGGRRHPMAAPVMTATAALLLCDAWFDIVLDWGSAAVWASVASAALVEIPLAAVLLAFGRQMLSGGMARHVLTAGDVRAQRDSTVARVMTALADGPLDTGAIATRTGLTPHAVTASLGEAANVRQVRRLADGRWRQLPVSFERPSPAGLGEADRRTLEAFYDEKLHQELELFAWAAARHHEFGEWAKGSRSSMWLTERELRRFDREYLDLVLRYGMLHQVPAEGTREFAVRWYAFPTRDEFERGVVPGPQPSTAQVSPPCSKASSSSSVAGPFGDAASTCARTPSS